MTTTKSSRKRLLVLLVFALAGAVFGSLFDQKTLVVSFLPVAFLILLPFFLIEPESSLRAFQEGALFGLTANVLGIRWLLGTMETYGHLPWPLAWGGLLLFSSYLSLFPAFFRLATFRLLLWPSSGGRSELAPKAVLVAPALWIISEAGKTEILTGFPWNPLGSVFFGHQAMALPSRVIGTTGLSFALVTMTTLIALFLTRIRRSVRTGMSRRPAMVWGGLILLALGLWPLSGNVMATRAMKSTGTSLRVALIQGNIPPDQKWTSDHMRGDLGTYLDLSRKEIRQGAQLIIWPETALPVLYNAPLPYVTTALSGLLEPGVLLITGSVGEVPSPGEPMGVAFTNAAVLFDGTGKVRSDYIKQHLVPFGEYLPLPMLFGWLRPLLGAGGDMAHSNIPGRFLLPGGITVSPIICYEALYPSLVRESLGKDSGVLAVISDDAWFGNTSAPYQLFRESAMRAIENGIPMVRAANTGLSGVVALDGSIASIGPLFRVLSLDTTIGTGAPATFYRAHGEWVLKLSLLGLLLWISIQPLISQGGRRRVKP